MTLCTLSGVLYDRQGNTVNGESVAFHFKDGVRGTGDDVFSPIVAEVVTGSAGEISVTLETGDYIGRLKASGSQFEQFNLGVPDQATGDIGNYIDNVLPYTVPLVERAEAAAQSAEEDAAEAAASADSAAEDATSAANSADTAQAAALAADVPVFADVAAGLAGTVDGEVFVVIEDGGAHAYTRTDASTATDAGWLKGPEFATVAAMLASTGALGGAGQIVHAGGYRYQVAPALADDYQVITAGGTKLYITGTRDAKAYGAPADGTGDATAELQALIDDAEEIDTGFGVIRYVEIRDAVYSFRGLVFPSNIYVSVGNTTMTLLPWSFNTGFTNAQSRAMRRDTNHSDEPANDGTGDTYPVQNDSGIRAAVGAYLDNDGGIAEGDIVEINGFKYEAMDPSHEFYDAIPPEMRGGRADGVRFRPAMDENIHIVGCGGFVFNGGGVFNRFSDNEIGYREYGFAFAFCKNYSVSGVEIVNTAQYAISNEHVSGGTFKDIVISQPGWSDRTIEIGDPNWRLESGLPNQDGVNIRKGCKDMTIDGVSGQSGDDFVAITNLYPNDDSDGEKDNSFSSNWAPYGSETLRVKITNIKSKVIGSHHSLRVLSSDDNLIRFVTIDNWHDLTDQLDLAGNELGRSDYEAWGKFGDGRYGFRLSGPDAIRDIRISNVFTTARYVGMFSGPTRRVYFDGVQHMFDSRLGATSAARAKTPFAFIKGIVHESQRIVAATNTNPVSVTLEADHDLSTGDEVLITGVAGMVEIDDTTQTVTVTGPDTVTLDGVDGTAFGVFVPTPRDGEDGDGEADHLRSVDFLTQADHSFKNVFMGQQTAANGTNAGYMFDIRDGTQLDRCSLSGATIFSCRSFYRQTGLGTTVREAKWNDVTTYLMRGAFADHSSGTPYYGESSGSLTNFRSHGSRPFNQDGLDGPSGRFYVGDWWLDLDSTCPDVTSDDVAPPANDGSTVYFDSDTSGSSARSLMVSRDGNWRDAGLSWRNEIRCDTASGNASGITLTSGLNFQSAPPVGTRVRFLAATASGVGFGINIDGTGAIPGRTITGAEIPADYIRTDAETVATYDGTNWIIDRAPKVTSGNDGEPWKVVRYADGRMAISGSMVMTSPCNIAEGSGFKSNTATHSFPAAFFSEPRGVVEMGDSDVHRDIRLTTNTSIIVESWARASDASITDVVPYSATGYWYEI